MSQPKFLVAALTLSLSSALSAHTQAWYAENIEAARAKEAECRRRLKANEHLGNDELAECQRAAGAVIRDGKFVKSKPVTW